MIKTTRIAPHAQSSSYSVNEDDQQNQLEIVLGLKIIFFRIFFSKVKYKDDLYVYIYLIQKINNIINLKINGSFLFEIIDLLF